MSEAAEFVGVTASCLSEPKPKPSLPWPLAAALAEQTSPPLSVAQHPLPQLASLRSVIVSGTGVSI